MRAIKISTIGFIILLPVIAFGQYNNGFFDRTFFEKLPSARAEAMGKAYNSVDGDLSSVFFNPAGIASIQGLVLDGNYAARYQFQLIETTRFNSIGYKINDYLILALSRNYYSYGNDVPIQDSNLNPIDFFEPYNVIHSLTISSQPIRNLFLGLNANLFCWYFGQVQKPYTLYFDIGVIKKFDILKKANSNQSANIGASITNFNFAKSTSHFKGFTSVSDLPVITRYGANYQFTFDRHWLFDSLNTLQFLMQGEYQMLLNSDYHKGYHIGSELILFEILSLRIGYYNEKEHTFPPENYVMISDLRYGFGVQIPLYKLSIAPFIISFDYLSLANPSIPNPMIDVGYFTSFNIRFNWIMYNNHTKKTTDNKHQ
jgi:hypothetical protein